MKLWVPQVKVSFRVIEIGQKIKQKSKKPAFAHRRLWGLGASFALLILISVLVWRTLSSPAHGNVAVLSQDSSNQVALPEYTTLTTNFYSLSYSERYTQKATDIPPAGVLDYKVLAYEIVSLGESKVEISVKAAPDGGIVLDSTYDYYVKHQDRFKMTNRFYHGETIDIARSTKGQPETTGLWLHNSFLLIIKITTPDKQQSIDGELKDMLSSVQWRDS